MEENVAPPDLNEQAAIILKELQSSMAKGETWYLIDYVWLKQWKKYVGFDAKYSEFKGIETEHPGKIDNSSLLVEEDGIVDLKLELYYEVDYVLIPAKGWNHLLSWYSIVEGQEPISRIAVEHGLYTKDIKVEVYLTSLSLCLNSDPDNVTVKKYSKATELDQIMMDMKKIYNVPEDEDTRLWSRYMNNTYEMLKNLPNATVESSGLYSGQVLLLEQKGEDGCWARHTRTRSLSGSSLSYPSVSDSPIKPQERSYGSYNFFSSDKRRKQSVSSEKSGLCGLGNLGNTCFMNSSLQCLSNTLALTKFFLADNYKSELNHSNPMGTGGRIAKAYAELLKQMWSGVNNYVIPRDFKVQVGRFAPQLSGYQQQDSHELLAFLLDGLHEDLNRVKKKPYIEIPDADGRPDEVVAGEAWKNHMLRNDSIIVDLFHGLFKSTVVCPVCSKVSIKFDPFCYLTLPLPSKNERALRVTFVPLDATKLPTQIIVKCPKNGTVSNLLQSVSNLTGLPSDKMIVADVFNHRFHKIFNKHRTLSYIEDRDTTYIYEIPISMDKYEDSELLLLPVYHRELKKRESDGIYSSYSGSATLFGVPMLVPVPRQNVNYKDLYELLLKRMRRFIGTIETEGSSHLTENDSENKEEDSDSDKMDETDSQSMQNGCEDSDSELPVLFTVKSVNSLGNSVLKEFEDEGEALELTSQMYLSADWCPKEKLNYYVESAAEAVYQHESVREQKSGKNTTELSDCLNLFLTKEKLGEDDPWYCPTCKQHQQATKKFDLWTLPKIVVIHLKRFSYTRFLRDKLDTLVDFPVRNLDLSQFVSNKDHPRAVYDLHAVSNHYGGLGGGHYTAYAKNPNDGCWYYFDDSSVTIADEKQIVSKAAYLLFYCRREDPTHEEVVANDLLSDDENVQRFNDSKTMTSDDDNCFEMAE